MSKVMDWLLEQDTDNPGVRTFALTNLLDRPDDDPEVIAARRAVMEQGPVPTVLAAQDPAGFWEKPSSTWPNWVRPRTIRVCGLAASTCWTTAGPPTACSP
jgi:hypothetical protein